MRSLAVPYAGVDHGVEDVDQGGWLWIMTISEEERRTHDHSVVAGTDSYVTK